MNSAYLRVSIFDRCNLRCRYCGPNSSTSSVAGGLLSDHQVVDLVSSIDRAVPLEKIRLTGGEPLIRPKVVGLVAALHERLPDTKLALTTNGIGLRHLAPALKDAGLDAINISIDTLDSARFTRLTGGALGAVLQGLESAKRAGFDELKLNSVLLRRYNADQIEDLVRLAASLECEVRFIELMPFGVAARLFAAEYLPGEVVRRQLERLAGALQPLPTSGSARRYRLTLDGRTAVVGLITPVSDPFCTTCNRIRVDAGGTLFSCLRGKTGVDLAPLLRAGRRDEIAASVRALVESKQVTPLDWPHREMVAIGG